MIRVLQGTLETAEMEDFQEQEVEASFWRRVMAKSSADVPQEDK